MHSEKILTEDELRNVVKCMLYALESNWPKKPKSVLNLSMVLGGAVANTAAKVSDEYGDQTAVAMIRAINHGAEAYEMFKNKAIH